MKTLATNPLLIELLTEELPPKALSRLGEVFYTEVFNALIKQNLVKADEKAKWFATPRRLAMLIPNVQEQAPESRLEEKLMPVSVALDANGQPTPALLKKLEAKSIPVSEVAKFERRMDGKAEAFFYSRLLAGAKLDAVLANVIANALGKLPIPKLMRWGDTDYQFVRPVHGLIMLHGSRIVPGEVLGLLSSNRTRGHRFLSQGSITINNANDYEEILRNEGKVVASFTERRAIIDKALEEKAHELGAMINPSNALLDEVTALVEWPVVYVSAFEKEYLQVPQECLILTMQQHQKYFPLLSKAKADEGKLINQFLVVSNMQMDDPKHIIDGNARVIRPRLSDARFFFNQDRKQRLDTRLEKLAHVVYHNKLGSVLERVERLAKLAGTIAEKLNANAMDATLAARLCKADLATDMVGEFPELQGVMGRYYALHDGEKAEVAEAINAHYRPRFAGDALPEGAIACAVALADKLDALTGFFGIGQIPTGDKDPFGLRRAALGILRILLETPLPLDLRALLADSAGLFKTGLLKLENGIPAGIEDFILERLRGLLRDAGFAPEVIESVLITRPTRIDLVPARLKAVQEFLLLPEALALASANKRIGNILKKSADEKIPTPNATLMTETAEKALLLRVNEVSPQVQKAVAAQDYTNALKLVASVRAEVDLFFDKVMVNVEDAAIRNNRLGLLKSLFDELNAVADISRLSV